MSIEEWKAKYWLSKEAKEAGFKFPEEFIPVEGEDGLEVVKTKPQELPLIESEDEEC